MGFRQVEEAAGVAVVDEIRPHAGFLEQPVQPHAQPAGGAEQLAAHLVRHAGERDVRFDELPVEQVLERRPLQADGFRRHVDGGWHLARGARHAAVGDQGDLEALVLQDAEDGRELVQLGHAVGLRALPAQHAHQAARRVRFTLALEFAGGKGLEHFFLGLEDAAGRLDEVALGRHRRHRAGCRASSHASGENPRSLA